MTSLNTTMIIVLKNGQRIGITEETYNRIEEVLLSDNIPRFFILEDANHVIAINMIAEIRPDSWAIKGAKDDG